MVIVFIKHPYCFTDDGERLNLDDIEGTPKVGSELKKFKDKYLIKAVTSDSECVNGVCPVR